MKNRNNLRKILSIILASVIVLGTGSISLIAYTVDSRESKAEFNNDWDKTGDLIESWNNRKSLVPILPIRKTDIYGKTNLPTIEYKDLKYEHYELSDYKKAGQKFLASLGLSEENILEKPEEPIATENIMKDALEEYLEEYDKFMTLASIAQLKYTEDVNDEEVAAELKYTEKINNDIFNESLKILQGVQNNTFYQKTFNKIIGEKNAKDLAETPILTAKQKSITEQLSDLQQEYDKSKEDYKNRSAIYLDIVELKNNFAQEVGYKNYVEYNAKETFGRDYNAEELQNFYRSIKQYISPLYVYLSFMTNYQALEGYSYGQGEDAASIVRNILGNISSELLEPFEYLINSGMYKLGTSANNQNVSYTISLPEFDSAAVFVKSSTAYNDLATLVHEFGHFNTAIRDKNQSFFSKSNVDIAEIHSQALEVLFFPYAKIIYGNLADDVIKYQLINMLWSILTGCVFNEFENYAYTTKDLTANKLNAKFKELCSSYKLGLNEGFWTNIWHLYHSPLYYISYAVSAVATLSQLGPMKEDYAATVDRYLKLTSFGQDKYPFKETLAQAKYPDIFTSESIKKIADAINDYIKDPLMFDLDMFDLGDVQDENEEDNQDNKANTDRTIVPEYSDKKNKDNTSDEDMSVANSFSDIAWNGNTDNINSKFKQLPKVIRYILSGDIWDDINQILNIS